MDARSSELIDFSVVTITITTRFQDADPREQTIQEATASEPLSITQEYAMQESWRRDADKLTFIICQPLPIPGPHSLAGQIQAECHDTADRMIGDVNLFLSLSKTDDDDEVVSSKLRLDCSKSSDLNINPQNSNLDVSTSVSLTGEIELMIPRPTSRRRGHGRSALLTFLTYILTHESEIVAEFLHSRPDYSQQTPPITTFLRTGRICPTAKISHTNHASLALFESLGFEKMSEQPNYFGEFELELRFASGRMGGEGGRAEAVSRLMESWGVGGYREVGYGIGDGDGDGEGDDEREHGHRHD